MVLAWPAAIKCHLSFSIKIFNFFLSTLHLNFASIAKFRAFPSKYVRLLKLVYVQRKSYSQNRKIIINESASLIASTLHLPETQLIVFCFHKNPVMHAFHEFFFPGTFGS